MKKITSSLLALVILLSVFLSVPVTASAASNLKSLGHFEIEETINPLYKGLIDEKAVISEQAEVYYANELFDASKYSSDKNIAAVEIREAMENRENSVSVYYKTTEEFDEAAHTALYNEVQELAFEETDKPTQGDSLRLGYRSSKVSISGVSDGINCYYKYDITYTYYTTKLQEEELTKAVDELVESFGFTEKTTEKKKSDVIYRYITDNVVYDTENLSDSTYLLKFTPYAALVNKTAVCQGYALLYYRLAEECGLDSRVITGTSFDENHAWNIVKIGENYFHLDSTWDAGKVTYQYYLRGISFPDHIRDAKYYETEFVKKYPISIEPIENVIVPEKSSGVAGDFKYDVYDDIAYITEYTGSAENVVVPSVVNGYDVYYVRTDTFDNKDTIKTITFSEGIRAMEGETIHHCDKLETINIPSTMDWNVTRYDSENLKFARTGVAPLVCGNMKTVNVAAGNPYLKVVNGILYSSDMEVLIYCPEQYSGTVVKVPEGVKEITGSSFEGCSKIQEVQLPDSVLLIGYWAFSKCFALEKCDIPANCEVIGQYAFQHTKITSIHIPKSLQLFIPGAYSSCLIEKITVDENSEMFYVKNDALCSGNTLLLCAGSCGKEEYVVSPEIVTISVKAFSDAEFKKITLNDGLKYIDSSAFSNAKVRDLVIPDGVLEIGDAAFYCALTTLVIPDSVEKMENIAPRETRTHYYYQSEDSYVYQYLTNNGFVCKPVSEFKCSAGHNFEKKDYPSYYEYICSVCGGYGTHKNKKDMYHAEIELVKEQILPSVDGKPKIKSITYEGVELVEGVDYVIEEPVMEVGYHYLNVKGIGDYYNVKQARYQVLPETLEIPIASTELTAEGIKVAWPYVDNADSYVLYRREYNPSTKKYTSWKVIYTVEGSVGYVDTAVKLGTTYSYAVRAVKGTVKSKYVATKGLKFNWTPEVKISNATKGIKVTWSKVANATGYKVYSSTYNAKTKKWSGWKLRGTAKATAAYWTDTKVQSGTYYKYTVRAVNGSVNGSYNKSGVSLARLAQPTTKIANTATGIKVSWNKVAGATGYRVYRSEIVDGKWTSWKTMGTAKSTASYWVDRNAVSGTTYRYTVRAVRGKALSSYKATSGLMYLAQPTVTVKAEANGFNVSWSESEGATSYVVYRKELNTRTNKFTSWKAMVTLDSENATWLDTSAKKGVTYRYTVRAVNGNYKSSYSAGSSVKR